MSSHLVFVGAAPAGTRHGPVGSGLAPLGMTGYAERIADPKDSLRTLLQAAKVWRVPPTVFLGERTVSTDQWTDRDTVYALALEDYEAGLCPGGNHVLAETSRPEHRDAYRPGERLRCHYCTMQAKLNEALENEKDAAGLLIPLVLDPDAVALNRLPVPPLPPELAGQ